MAIRIEAKDLVPLVPVIAFIALIAYGNVSFQKMPGDDKVYNISVTVSESEKAEITPGRIVFSGRPGHQVTVFIPFRNTAYYPYRYKLTLMLEPLYMEGWTSLGPRDFVVDEGHQVDINMTVIIPNVSSGTYSGFLIVNSTRA